MNTTLLARQIQKLEILADAVSVKLADLAKNNQPFDAMRDQASQLDAYISGLRDAAELIGFDPQSDIEANPPHDLVYLFGSRSVEWRNLSFAVSEQGVRLQ